AGRGAQQGARRPEAKARAGAGCWGGPGNARGNSPAAGGAVIEDDRRGGARRCRLVDAHLQAHGLTVDRHGHHSGTLGPRGARTEQWHQKDGGGNSHQRPDSAVMRNTPKTISSVPTTTRAVSRSTSRRNSGARIRTKIGAVP